MRSMSQITDAIFFLRQGKIVKQMMISEFDALLEGVVQLNEFNGQQLQAVFLQINDHLKLKGLIFFTINFDRQGVVAHDWNIPFNQLWQSASRGPDLGAGPIRLVNKSLCATPWLADNLYDPPNQLINDLVQAVKTNKLGILESDNAWHDEQVPMLKPITALDTSIPVLSPDDVPTLAPVSASNAAIPVAEPQGIAGSDASPLTQNTANKQSAEAEAGSDEASENSEMDSQAFKAMQQALTIKLSRLQKDYDALQEKSRKTVAEVKQQAKEHVEHLLDESRQDLARRDQQILSLKQQLQHEQKRYQELKEQQVEQVASYQEERENLLDQLEEGQTLESKKIANIKEAFAKEIDARIEAETTKLNEQLAIREVELFYREEQMSLLASETQQLKNEKQRLLSDSGNQILKQLEDNGVTFVVYHVGVGHITLALEDVGRYLEQRSAYLAERSGISLDDFMAWQEHFNQPCCTYVNSQGEPCTKELERVEWAASFKRGDSDRCAEHKA